MNTEAITAILAAIDEALEEGNIERAQIQVGYLRGEILDLVTVASAFKS